MKHGFAFVQQIVRDDTSMAAPPYRFRTHDCAALAVSQRAQRVETGPERSGHRVICIIMETVVVPKGVYGRRNAMFPSAQTAERREVIVGDVKLSKRSRQRVAIVLRVGARSRYGSDVGDERDLRLLQQVHEFREGPCRVSDREDG